MMAMFKVLFLLCGLVAVAYSAAVLTYGDACPAAGNTCNDGINLYCYQEYSTTGCTAAVCSCKRGFIRVGTNCVEGLALDAACSGAQDACNVPNSECLSSLCACSTDYEELSGFCVLSVSKKIGETCTTLSDRCHYESEGKLVDIGCPNGEGGAATSTCQCDTHTKQFGATCLPIKIGDTCALDDECPLKSTCTGSPNVCTCEAGVYGPVTDNTACVLLDAGGIIADGAACTAADADTKCAAGLSCSTCVSSGGTNICNTKKGLLTEVCTIASDCASNIAICTNSKCTCPAGYVAFGKTQCITTGALDSVCLFSEDCTGDPHAACTARKCACAATYFREGNVCIEECTEANAAEVCPTADNKECDIANKKCKCMATFLERDDTCVSGKMGGACTTNDHCTHLENSQCKGAKCTCAEGYTVSGEKCDTSGAGIKAVWMPIVILSGLVPVLYMMLL